MRHILLIEDNIEMSENTAEILELSSYKVTTAFNGKEGVQKALDLLPDLILCDIMMPEMDGYGVVYALNKNDKTANIPFLFLTARADKSDLRKGMELGADDYITKPYTSIELLTAIETRLKKIEHSRQLESPFKVPSEQDIVKHVKLMIDENQFVRKYFAKKELIYTEGSLPYHVFFINSGLVKISKSVNSSKEIISQLVVKNDLFGYNQAVCNEPYVNYATALEETEIIMIPKDLFMAELTSNAGLHLNLERQLTKRENELENKLFLTAYFSVKRRVSNALIQLAEIYEETLNSELILLSREDLANYIGVSPETVIRALSELKEKGFISIETGKIKVLDKQSLRTVRH